jgi:hypothetical protein
MPARLLSLPPAAWVGRISYGLYLWHWPVILAVTTAWGPFRLVPGSFATNGERVALTFVIATGSFYLLEQPIRRGRMPALGPSLRRFATATLVAIVAVGAAAYWQTSAASPQTGPQDVPCQDYDPCLRHRAQSGAPVVAVLGDSIARSMDQGFLDLARAHGWTYVLEGSNSCRVSGLLTNFGGVVRPVDQKCHERVPGAERALLDEWHPDLIVVIDRSERRDIDDRGRIVVTGTAEHEAMTAAALADFARMITASGSRLAFLELPPPIPGDCFLPNQSDRQVCHVGVDSDAVTNEATSTYRNVAAAVPGVFSISVSDGICPGGACVPIVNGLMIRYDGNHFSAPAAERLAPLIYRRLDEAGALP